MIRDQGPQLRRSRQPISSAQGQHGWKLPLAGRLFLAATRCASAIAWAPDQTGGHQDNYRMMTPMIWLSMVYTGPATPWVPERFWQAPRPKCALRSRICQAHRFRTVLRAGTGASVPCRVTSSLQSDQMAVPAHDHFGGDTLTTSSCAPCVQGLALGQEKADTVHSTPQLQYPDPLPDNSPVVVRLLRRGRPVSISPPQS